MFRRLNFLIPNVQLAQKVINELNTMGINKNNIHTYSEHSLPSGSLNPATKNQVNNEAQQVENIFWNGNLLLFFIFLSVFIVSIIVQQFSLALLSLAVMLLSFTAGNFFVKHIPHIHFGNFKHAINHNELLMMVDVPDERVNTIESAIHRHHPAAVEGGSSWSFKNIDL